MMQQTCYKGTSTTERTQMTFLLSLFGFSSSPIEVSPARIRKVLASTVSVSNVPLEVRLAWAGTGRKA
jgi:hypothetical protein